MIILCDSETGEQSYTAGMASHIQAMKRLAKEARSIESSPPPYISASPIDDDNLYIWRAILSGVRGTPLEGTAIVVELTFPTDYPKTAPKAGFCTPIPCTWRVLGY